jgi:pyruvate-ferredoxin/flavodoxin oxidoreductase
VYVATVAMGANPQQTLEAFREAEAYQGPSLILAYSQCIAHGIDMRLGMRQQSLAVASGHWPLIRFNPELRSVGANPFQLDSPRPTITLKEYAYNERRYKSLAAVRPEEAARLAEMAQAVATERYRSYEELAQRDGSRFHPPAEGVARELGGAPVRRADYKADPFRTT